MLALSQACAKSEAVPAGVAAPSPSPGQQVDAPATAVREEMDEEAARRGQLGVRIATYFLSAGDEIRIGVWGYGEFDRTLQIPPGGLIYYPLVGQIAVEGMSIPELRSLLTEGLRSAPEQRIATGDEISIKVYRHEDLDVTTIVPSSGRVTLPLGGGVELAGLTVEEANEAISETLSRYLLRPSISTTIRRSALPGRISDPHVTVEVLRFGGHKVLVLGEVEQPGVYVNDGGGRVLEMVVKAGGPTDEANLTNVAFVRPATETSPPQATIINLRSAIQEGDYGQNPPIQRGDIIYIPKTTIANVARFFDYLYAIVRPFVLVETGIWLGQNIDEGPRGRGNTLIFQ